MRVLTTYLRQLMKRRAFVYNKRQDATTLRMTFDLWAIAERGQLLVRVHDTRITRQVWTSWQARQAAVHSLEGKQGSK